LATHQSKAVAASLRSLYKLNHVYEDEFRVAAAADAVDVVSYRIFDGRERPTMALLGKALDHFQSLYTVLYSAVSSGRPKDTAHISAEVIQKTSFQFAYTYSGSVGFVFTLPNERLLLGETELDEAMQDLFQMAKASGTEAIKSFALKFGMAPIRAIYKWASALSASGVGADIEWGKGEISKNRIILQPAEIEALKNWIDQTSELEIDENDYVGKLVGFNSKNHSFLFEPPDSTAIRGTIAENADIQLPVKVPEFYTARIRTTSRVRYSTEQQDIYHELIALSEGA
jgi:hypothetical protein